MESLQRGEVTQEGLSVPRRSTQHPWESFVRDRDEAGAGPGSPRAQDCLAAELPA